MDAKHIKQLIVKGECIEVEFKESRHSLHHSEYETICAFLNRKGGHILFGVKKKGLFNFVAHQRQKVIS